MLKAEDMVFKRGEDGNLIPVEVTLEAIPDKPSVLIRPLSRGKFQEIYQKATGSPQEKLDADNEVIKSGLVEPKLTEQQIQDFKPMYAGAIVNAILAISTGMSQEEIAQKTQEQILSDELKKN